MVRIALAHRLLTQFTSFVAVEDRVVNAGGKQTTVTVPVELPHGVEEKGVFGDAAGSAGAAALAGLPEVTAVQPATL